MAAESARRREFQAVLMAGGNGNRMQPLCDGDQSKALLPVGNTPMIEYSLRMLDQHGFPDVIVIAQESASKELAMTLEQQQQTGSRPPLRMKLDITTIPDESDMGTADALRLVSDKIHTDFLVFSCDLITNIKLHHVVDVHRLHDATATFMLFQPPPKTEAELKALKVHKKSAAGALEEGMSDLVAISPATGRVVLFSNKQDLEEDVLPIRRSVLKEHPTIDVRSNLMDPHLYVFSRRVLDILRDRKRISTIKGDLLPYLVRKQRTVRHGKPPSPAARLGSIGEPEDLATQGKSEPITCYAHIVSPQTDEEKEATLCIRANTVQLFQEANRLIPSYLSALLLGDADAPLDAVHGTVKLAVKSQVGDGSMVDEQTVIGSRTSVKRSIVGKHCTLGDKVRLTNCIIMDYVRIEDACTLSNSIICKNAHVSTNCKLEHCQVGEKTTVVQGTSGKNEMLLGDVDDYVDGGP